MTNMSRVKLVIAGFLALTLSTVANWLSRSSSSIAAPASSPTALNTGVVRVLTAQDTLRDKREYLLPELNPEYIYSLSLSVDSPRAFGSEAKLRFVLSDAKQELVGKSLHLGDPDIYVTFRPTVPGPGKIVLGAAGAQASSYPFQLKVLRWKLPRDAEVDIEAEPNNSWRQANPIHLGRTVFGSGDDHLYIPLLGQSAKQAIEDGEDWFRFEFTENKPKLVFFMIDLAERDNIPVDVSVYRVENENAKAYQEGMDPVTPPHEVQALAGNKFTTRVLKEKGTYYVRVIANHPFYQLRTGVYDMPPFSDPRRAVRTAIDYIVSAGDSWHANTPRKGGVYDRVANVHQETSLCVACHTTHFPLRAQLYAVEKGYFVRQRPQVQFLTERFYNNPRPFYGHPGATWARVISAPANVLSRMAALLDLYEREVTNEHRDRFFKGVGEYLRLYYKGRTKLPPDETNGNTPIVSTYEVAWYSWVVLNQLYHRTSDKSYLEYANQLRQLIEQTDHKNLLDLCYQTLAFCTIDRERYRGRIRENCEKILSYQRPSGQWAMTLETDAPEAEFQTGHCLWVLGVAGYTPEDPRIAKAVGYLLGRQQPFGGWFDPLQPYENFGTPFRETQMAVLSLSELYPASDKPNAKAGNKVIGWGRAFAAPPSRLDFTRIDRLLADLDNIWDPPSRTLLNDIVAAAEHDDALVRQAAVACLGRVGDASAVSTAKVALGDPSKMVQRAAAWALRQMATRKGVGFEAIAAALEDPKDRVRWGATRVFATHFAYLAQRADLAERLLRLAQDPVATIRMQALKGLWLWWYWTDDENLRSRIEDLFIARLGEPEHPWVRRNLQEGLYNLADENIRYLYNNWVPLLGTEEDRDRAIRARLLIERRLAEKAARAIKGGNDLRREGVLRGLSEFHLRNADSYDINKKQPRQSSSLYVRIGNDIETIQFFGESVEILTRALLPLLNSPDAETRRLATKASFVLREARVAQSYGSVPASGVAAVVALAGTYEEGRQLLARALYHRLMDSDQSVRAAARDVYKSFTLDAKAYKADVATLLRELLASPYTEAQVAALEAIRTAGVELSGESHLRETVRKYLLGANTSVLGAALRAVEAFPELSQDPEVLVCVEKALVSDDLRVVEAAVELGLSVPQIGGHSKIAPKLDRVLATKDSKTRRALVSTLGANRALLNDRRVISLLSEALVDSDTGVIGAAFGIVRQERALQTHPAILAALGELRTNPKVTSEIRYFANGIYHGENPSDLSRARTSTPPRTLDYAYFKDKIQPILQRPGRDGNACVQCHATHAIFKLNPPPPNGQYTEEQLRENYRSALKVVDVLEPEKSLILRKPTSTSESEGVIDSARISHGGGLRWGTDSDEYRTILEWINGAKKRIANNQ